MLFISLPVWGLTDIERIIDPDNADGTDYTSLDAWEDAFGGHTSGNGDLVGDDERAVALCRSSSGSDDLAVVDFGGWTNTDATRYQYVRGTDFPSDGVFDGTKYVLHNNDSDFSTARFNGDEALYVRFKNIQVQVTQTSTNTRHGFYTANTSVAGDNRIEGCIIKGVCSGTGSAVGISNQDAQSKIQIFNSIITGFVSGADSDFFGIWANGDTNIYNCTIYGNYIGIYRSAGTCVVKNCAIGNNVDDISGTVTADYNCDDDNDGTNNQSPSGGNWDNEFITPGTDFDLESGGNCVGNGWDDPGSGLYSDDIIGTARSSTWDIGAYELVAAPAPGGQVITIQMSMIPLFLITALIFIRIKR